MFKQDRAKSIEDFLREATKIRRYELSSEVASDFHDITRDVLRARVNELNREYGGSLHGTPEHEYLTALGRHYGFLPEQNPDLYKTIDELDVSVRARNCLEASKIRYVGELVQKTMPDLLQIRSFGKTPLREVNEKLAKMGLHLGMKVNFERPNPAFFEPVSNLDLSVRARCCLKGLNIRYVGDLVQTTEEQLLAYKNMGETTLNEIKTQLSASKLSLGMRADGYVPPTE